MKAYDRPELEIILLKENGGGDILTYSGEPQGADSTDDWHMDIFDDIR